MLTDYPEVGKVVDATLQHWYTKNQIQAELVHVDEDDVTWRTVDDNSELSYDYNVIDWKYK